MPVDSPPAEDSDLDDDPLADISYEDYVRGAQAWAAETGEPASFLEQDPETELAILRQSIADMEAGKGAVLKDFTEQLAADMKLWPVR